MIKERRTTLRAGIYHLVKYSLVSECPGARKVLASLKDFSAGGICLLADEELPEKAIIRLEINLPEIEQPVSALAEVLWKKRLKIANKYKIGIRFVEIEESVRNKIMERIESVHRRLRR